MSNFIISYPSSGRTWTEHRILIFLHVCLKQDDTLFNSLRGGHYGYTPQFHFVPWIAKDNEVPKASDNTTIILRNGLGVVPSFYHHAKNIRHEKTDMDIDTFCLHQLGIVQYCEYLNNVNTYIKPNNNNIRWIYYEELFDKSFIYKIPEILGVSHTITEEEATIIYNSTTKESIKGNRLDPSIIGTYAYNYIQKWKDVTRKGTVNGYKEEIKQETIDTMKTYLSENCNLEEYRIKYL